MMWCIDCAKHKKGCDGESCYPVRLSVSDVVDTSQDTQKVINTAIGTAVGIVNMSDDEHIQEMAANIADTLIALTK